MPEEYSGGMDKTAKGGEEAQRQGGKAEGRGEKPQGRKAKCPNGIRAFIKADAKGNKYVPKDIRIGVRVLCYGLGLV